MQIIGGGAWPPMPPPPPIPTGLTSKAWFTSYLGDRQQAVVHGNGLSAFTYMKSGVPQGFILGPTLFLLFINDLPLFVNYCYSDFFADDATLHTHDNKPNKVEEKLQCGTDNVMDWSRQNNMHINYDKTNYMILGRTNKQNASQEFDIRIDDKHIKKTQNHKLLGIHIDDKLSWSSHIDHLCSSVSSKISLLRQLSKYVSTDVQKKFYQGYILPLIDNGSVVWGTTSLSNLDRISKLQKTYMQISILFQRKCSKN